MPDLVRRGHVVGHRGVGIRQPAVAGDVVRDRSSSRATGNIAGLEVFCNESLLFVLCD